MNRKQLLKALTEPKKRSHHAQRSGMGIVGQRLKRRMQRRSASEKKLLR
jgi:hypothetical protein